MKNYFYFITAFICTLALKAQHHDNQIISSKSNATTLNASAGKTPADSVLGNSKAAKNSAYDCPEPLSNAGFKKAKASVKALSSNDTKAEYARQIIQNNCLNSEQVKQLLLLMNFEQTKLDLAKFAYKYTCDKRNYYTVNKVFAFESSTKELEKYVNSVH